MTAYDVQPYQVTAPDWMGNQRYDIIAKVPPGATKAQVNVMWQNLLKERFGMLVHHESKDFPVDELTVAKGGVKMKETDLPPDAESFTPVAGPPKFDKNGFPEMNGTGMITMINMGPNSTSPNARTVAKGLSSPEIANRLAGLLRRPVVDKTGLPGKYDFTLEYTPDLQGMTLLPPPGGGAGPGAASPGNASDPPTSIASAVEKQLGLKLTSTKGKLDVVVVDRAEKVPTEN